MAGADGGDEKEQKVANALKVRFSPSALPGPRGAMAPKGSYADPPSPQLRHCLCEKQSKSLEALAKLREGVSFDKVRVGARRDGWRAGGLTFLLHQVCTEFSEDKARQGGSLGYVWFGVRGTRRRARS